MSSAGAFMSRAGAATDKLPVSAPMSSHCRVTGIVRPIFSVATSLPVDLKHTGAASPEPAMVVEGECGEAQPVALEIEPERVLAGRERVGPSQRTRFRSTKFQT
jgi:hypothetical protein